MHDQSIIPTRTCSECEQTLPVTSFHKKGNGYRSRCKECRRIEKAEYTERNKAAIDAANAAYREANRERLRGDYRQWTKDHPERTRDIQRQSRQKNAERVLASNQTYRAANPDLYRLAYEKRRALQLSTADGTVTIAAWREVVAYYGGSCAYCGQPVDVPEQEHMIPLSRDGAHTITNLVPACRACNARKSDKTFAEFLLAGG